MNQILETDQTSQANHQESHQNRSNQKEQSAVQITKMKHLLFDCRVAQAGIQT